MKKVLIPVVAVLRMLPVLAVVVALAGGCATSRLVRRGEPADVLKARLVQHGITLATVETLDDGTLSVTLPPDPALTDLALLQRMPITRLSVSGCGVSDLSPVKRLPLTHLSVCWTAVSDLSPLKHMALQTLDMDECNQVQNDGVLAVDLAGLPKSLRRLSIKNTIVRDLSLIMEMPLEDLELTPVTILKGLEIIADHGTLRTVNGEDRELFVSRFAAHELWSRVGRVCFLSGATPRSYGEDEMPPVSMMRRPEDLGGRHVNHGWSDWNMSLSYLPIADLSPLKGVHLEQLNVAHTKVTNISVVLEADIKRLYVGNTDLAVLPPLKGASLKWLHLDKTKVTDLSPLAGSSLEGLNITDTEVSDLSPLQSVPLKHLQIAGTKVTDLSPLLQIPTLKNLNVGRTSITNMEVLRDLDLRRLEGMTNLYMEMAMELARDKPGLLALDRMASALFTALNDERLAALRDALPKYEQHFGFYVTFLRELSGGNYILKIDEPWFTEIPALKGFPVTWVDIRNTGASSLSFLEGSAVTRLNIAGTRITNLAPLRGTAVEYLDLSRMPIDDYSPLAASNVKTLVLRKVKPESLATLAGLKIKELNINWTKTDTLSPLSGLGLEVLQAKGTGISDLSPLRGMPLRKLDISGTMVSDLEPLEGMNLQELIINNTVVSNLNPISGMQLKIFECDGTPVQDLSPVKGMPLVEIVADGSVAANLAELVKATPTLELINMQFAAVYRGETTNVQAEASKRIERLLARDDASHVEKRVLTAMLAVLETRPSWVHLRASALHDLSPFKGMPFADLTISDTLVSDLSPLRGMNLAYLSAEHLDIMDLSPLEGMPLEILKIAGSDVDDVRLLRDMPLMRLTVSWDRIVHGEDILRDKEDIVRHSRESEHLREIWEKTHGKQQGGNDNE